MVTYSYEPQCLKNIPKCLILLSGNPGHNSGKSVIDLQYDHFTITITNAKYHVLITFFKVNVDFDGNVLK